MAIWEFGDFLTEDLERIIEMEDELFEMGLHIFDEEMMQEVRGELQSRELFTTV